MAIVTCEHNPGGMGLCSQCAKDISESVDRSSYVSTRRRELTEAADIARRYGFYEEAGRLRRGAEGHG